MAYNNPYGVPPAYGVPPSYGGFQVGAPPGMAPPPGLGPPPGMSSAPGTAPPPGVQQFSATTQANRPSGIPASFQPPPNLPNINFNAPVIRLGSIAPPSKPGTPSDRRDSHTPTSGNRPGLGMDRGLEQSRAQLRESMQSLVPPTREERLLTIMVHKIPSGVGGEKGIQKLLGIVGKLRRWESALSHLEDYKGMLFGFAQYEDPESVASAIELLKDVEVPVKKQSPTELRPKTEDGADPTEDIEKVKLQYVVDPQTIKYLDALKEEKERRGQGEDREAAARLAEARNTLQQFVRGLFFPSAQDGKDEDGDKIMGDATNGTGENVEVINIPLAQEDELADIPAEMRETVAAEIAAFRDRSLRRDMERLRREEEFEEQERQRNGAPRVSRLDSPQPTGSANSNTVPLGPRGVPNAPSGPRGNRGVDFVNGGTTNGHSYTFKEEDDSDASDEELYNRELARQEAEDEKLYLEAERKWNNREKQRTAALDREQARERDEAESFARRKEEQLEQEKNWDDDREAARKTHPYYRDHAQWVKRRTAERNDEAARDEMDRRAEEDERRRAEADMEQARGMADSFLERQADEMMAQAAAEPTAAPQRFTISFGAAAQRAQAQRAPARRTIAEVEGLLDDEEQEQTTKRQLVPIKFEPITDTKAMTEEEMQNALKGLAAEIPNEREGLWAWDVKWDYLEESVIREKLRPFVEKRVVEYLGVQEQFLVDMVEEHLRKHMKPGDLVETLAEALDEDAEALVKKLWRMVIFFTESEKRGLPA
ncbi:hypothetical protein B0H66DRAFT_556357 [Apodospora peruviana]|uniref:PWI domain-containing protein n=1 Tax=Apodospora peruviana TaxID=516989 RepID=A0AAE0M3M4_9PEZI|nr:hypothetical protein B0H66DRAFT_556357 [Apodospora peruviana]